MEQLARCLALNTSFEPLTLVPMRRALRLVIDGKAEIVEAERGRRVARIRNDTTGEIDAQVRIGDREMSAQSA